MIQLNAMITRSQKGNHFKKHDQEMNLRNLYYVGNIVDFEWFYR